MPRNKNDSINLDDFPQLRPHDRYNRNLVGNVHPSDWSNPQPHSRYNMVVIGAGTAGLVTAAGTAGLGGKVALIEHDLMGGDCLNAGCVPSKALIRCARTVADLRNADQYGVRIAGGVEVDFAAVMERMRRLRADISNHDSAERFKQLGVDVYIGSAKFTGPDTVQVDGKTLKFARACIATGSQAATPPIPGLKAVDFLTNETVFSLTELPRRLGVIGAGPIGCELSQCFARFGSQVTLVEAMHGIMPNEDQKAAEIVKKAMTREGVALRCCGKKLEVRKESDGIHLTVESHESHYDEVVDRLLIAAGRSPNLQGLDLEAAGVAYDEKKGVTVNDRLQTTNRRVYAAGDVCFPYKFTHVADAMARIVIQNALFFGRSKASALTIPWCTYTDPEIAHVGLYPREAEKQGITMSTISIDLNTVDRAVLDGDGGFLDVYVKEGSDQILGATMVSRHAGDMISEITLAMVSGAGLGAIGKTIHPYPTVSEAIKKAGDAYNRKRLTPHVQRILKALLKWRR